MDKKIPFTFLAVVIICIVMVIYKNLHNSAQSCQPTFTVRPDTVKIGDPVYYADTGYAFTSIEWNFGDNSSVSNEPNGTHAYSNPGTYPFKVTYDGKCPFVKTIVVIKSEEAALYAQIESPSEGITGQPLDFVCVTNDKAASNFEWSFGETGRVDGHRDKLSYTYHKTGTFNVILKVNDLPPVTKSVKINRGSEAVPGTSGNAGAITDRELESLLQQYCDACRAKDDTKRDSFKKKLSFYFCFANSERTSIHDVTRDDDRSLKGMFRDVDEEDVTNIIVKKVTWSDKRCISNLELEIR